MTDTTNTDLDQPYLDKIDEAIREAAVVMELGDVAEELEGDDYETVYEARHHCGTCQVRTVLETVWPAIEEYVDYLKSTSSN
jgi:hypothetical protein